MAEKTQMIITGIICLVAYFIYDELNKENADAKASFKKEAKSKIEK